MTIKKPIPITFNLDSHQSVQSVCAVIHIDDKNTETLDLSLMQGGEHIAVSPNSTVTARFVRVKNNTLISDDIACTVQENGNVHIPIDNAAAHMLVGEIKIEVNIVDENDVLTMQFPLVIRVNNTILADAEICPISKGTIPELIEKAQETADNAQQAADNAQATASTAQQTADSAQTSANSAQQAANNAMAGLGNKQDKLTAGDGIFLQSNNTIQIDHYGNFLQWMWGQEWARDYNLNQPRPNTILYATARDWGSSLPENRDCYVVSLAPNQIYDMIQIAIVIYSKQMYIRTATNGAATKVWSDWTATGGGAQIVSGVVNEDGTITFTDSEDNSFTTSGESVIGSDGFSPSATVQQTASGATITVTDKSGTTTANISNGAPGQDYVLTDTDKQDIANIVLSELPTTEGVLYGNQSN